MARCTWERLQKWTSTASCPEDGGSAGVILNKVPRRKKLAGTTYSYRVTFTGGMRNAHKKLSEILRRLKADCLRGLWKHPALKTRLDRALRWAACISPVGQKMKMKIPAKGQDDGSTLAFLGGLGLVCASTLMYEIVLTRLLSVACWYYLAFVSVSMAMFGMTAGALWVQLRPDFFQDANLKHRLTQASLAMAVSMPLALMSMLAVPLQVSYTLETAYSYLLFSAIIAIPFFFSGVVVCLSITKTPFPIGRLYFADLLGASAGCLGSVLLLKTLGAPSVVLAISALLFLSSAAYAHYAGEFRRKRICYALAAGLVLLAGLNSLTFHGIRLIWSKEEADNPGGVLYEIWNPISKVRVYMPEVGPPDVVTQLPGKPPIEAEEINLDIDNDASTAIQRFRGNLKDVDYLRSSLTTFGPRLREGGTAAIIGVGGGRDVLTCSVYGFRRIVGIEVNRAIIDVTTRRLEWFSGFSKIPNFELHNDEARSYLTRSNEKFDLIQASLVDTWAATAAGAMSLSENSLYTVDAWEIFYRHLKPGGVISFTRWHHPPAQTESYRLLAVAYAMLLKEGVSQPATHLAVIAGEKRATLLASNQPFSASDLRRIRDTSKELGYQILVLPGEEPVAPEFRAVLYAPNLAGLAHLQTKFHADYSPVYDSSPYFFNSVRVKNIPAIWRARGDRTNLQATLSLFGFMMAALVMVVVTILLPARKQGSQGSESPRAPAGVTLYFIGIGLGFMFVEMGMMQQLSIFLGHPIYSLVVVLVGLIASTGIGSLVSDGLRLRSGWMSRLPALGSALIISLYAVLVIPTIHRFVAGLLWERVVMCLLLVGPCGFVMGFCFPVGLRWMTRLHQQTNLPWMWAVNGAASVLASSLAILLSMETNILNCVLAGACCYTLAGISLSPERTQTDVAQPEAVSVLE